MPTEQNICTPNMPNTNVHKLMVDDGNGKNGKKDVKEEVDVEVNLKG